MLRLTLLLSFGLCLSHFLSRAIALSIGNLLAPDALHGNFSYLSFNPSTQTDLWKAASKINNKTRAILFDPRSSLLDDALASNDTQQLVQLMNRVFANDLTANFSSSNDPITNSPVDPTTVTKSLGRQSWSETLYNYQRAALKIPVLQGQNMAILMKATVVAEMLSAGSTAKNVYPQSRFYYLLDPPGETWEAIWTLQESAAILYEDLFYAFETFGYWCRTWGADDQVVIPSCNFACKRTSKTGPEQMSLGNGKFEIGPRTQAAPIYATQ